MSKYSALRSFAFLLLSASLWPAVSFAQAPAQPDNLAPKKTSDGVLFQFLAPDATAVYLAGDFNSWGSANDGNINNPDARLEGPDKGGVWHKTVKLEPGKHSFKFNVGGTVNGWLAPEWATDRDNDGNALVEVAPGGDVLTRSTTNAAWKPQQNKGKVTFRYYAPSAGIVYLATEANNWGENQSGVISNAKYAMTRPGADGVWTMEVSLPPGKHTYKFVVEGDKWTADPNASEQDAEGNSVVVVK